MYKADGRAVSGITVRLSNMSLFIVVVAAAADDAAVVVSFLLLDTISFLLNSVEKDPSMSNCISRVYGDAVTGVLLKYNGDVVVLGSFSCVALPLSLPLLIFIVGC